MSVLQIVGTVVGGVIGAFGGPGGALLGASIGGAIGSVANSILNPVRTVGARLGDLSVSSSATGTARPIAYGRVRISGNIIWAIPLIEHSKTTSSKGGKGGPTSTTFDYGATFALGLCEGPVAAILKIWADSKLVYDASAGSDTVKAAGFNFRFYPGNGTQTADSIIVAHQGVGNVPGYRGTCYLVFDDIPLANYGNRIPNITVELTFNATPVFDVTFLTRAVSSIFSASLWSGAVAINPLSHFGYVFANGASGASGIVEFNVDSMMTTREILMSTVLAPLGIPDTGGNTPNGSPMIGWDEALYFITLDNTNGPNIIRVDPNTLLATAYFPAHPGNTFSTVDFFGSYQLCFLACISSSNGLLSQLVAYNRNNQVGGLNVPDLSFNWFRNDLDGTSPIGICQGRIAPGFGEGYVMGLGNVLGVTHWYISKMTFSGGNLSGTTVGLAADYVASDFAGSAVDFYGAGGEGSLVYDESDDSVVFHVSLIDGASTAFSVTVKWSQASGIIFSTITPIDVIGDPISSPMTRISGGTYARLNYTTPTVTVLDAATGAVISNDTWPISLGSAGSTQEFDSGTNVLVAYATDGISVNGWAKIRLGRLTAGNTTLGDIVSDQCQRAGFQLADFDVTPLTDVVDGYVVSQSALVVDILKPLFQLYLVDTVESDYVLYFKHRGGSPVAALTQDVLVRIDHNTEPFTESRQQEIDLPQTLTLSYTDSDSGFQINTQMAKRARSPNPTIFTDNHTDVQIGVVSKATPMKRRAEILLYSVWSERTTWAARLPPRFGFIDAADPVTLTLDDGYVISGRIGQADVGVDHSIDVTIIAQTDGQFVSTVTAAPAIPWAGSTTIATSNPSKLILLDSTLLRDSDDMAGTAIRGYWAGSYYTIGAGWPGGVLRMSPEGTTWTSIDSSANEATWGAIVVPPADPVSFWRTQFDGTMTIQITGGPTVPTSTDDLGLANLANPMIIVKANHDVEVIQYRDVASLGGGKYQLSTLYRGVRGTDAMGGGIASGDIFVFLSLIGVQEISLPLADFRLNEFYQLITVGSLPGSAMLQGFTYHGRDMMPYAPVHGAATVSTNGDIVLTWVRRTRFGGELRDGIDTVPLNEQTEAYEIDILSGVHGSVRRTLTATTTTVTYPSAAVLADFGAMPTALSVNFYQLSSVVGRGFTTEELLLLSSVAAVTASINLTSVPITATVGSGISIAFDYGLSAPSGLVAAWNPGNVPGTVSGFSASAGSGSATVAPPSTPATYTLTVTGVGANVGVATAPNATAVNGVGSPTLTLTSVPSTAAISTSLGIVFSYTVAAPTQVTAVWNPGGLPAVITSFSAAVGTGTATVVTPGSAATYTLSITGVGANTGSATAGNSTVVSSGSPALTVTSVPTSGVVSSGIGVTFIYSVAAPSGLTAVWNPGSIPATVTGFNVVGGTGTATLAAPGTPGTYTATITGTGANTASGTAPNTTAISAVVSGAVPQPTTSNRPMVSGSVLSWSGPSGGGASNGTYPAQTRTLTSSSAITTSGAGQVIEGLAISGVAGLDHGVVSVLHNNVTIRQCSILETTVDQPDRYTVWIANGITGTIIEDCLIDGHARNGIGGTGCVSGGPNTAVNGITMRRNHCTRSEQALRYTLNNCDFVENLCDFIGGTDADWVEVYPVGGVCNNLIVRYNAFWGTDNAAGGADSGVNLTTGSGLPVGNIGPNILIDSNWFIDWPTVHAVIMDNSSGGSMAYSFTNNGFFNCLGNFTPQSGVISPNSGNYFMATATSTSGTLINGTGQI